MVINTRLELQFSGSYHDMYPQETQWGWELLLRSVNFDIQGGLDFVLFRQLLVAIFTAIARLSDSVITP